MPKNKNIYLHDGLASDEIMKEEYKVKNMARIKKKVALITGAAQGIGLETAKLFIKEGAKVILADINEDKVDSESLAINREFPQQAIPLKLDVTQESDWKNAIIFLEKNLGKLDILVNNAGIGSAGNIEDENYEQWKHIHDVNLNSTFLGCKYAVSLMKKSKNGSIINVSSIAGIIAGHNMAAYNSAKAAVRHLSKSIALHCAKERNGIRCNSVHPAFIDTPILNEFTKKIGREIAIKKLSEQIPIGQIGDPIDVAYGILYLASNESKFVTGSELIIDGGISA